ncbi:MAG: ribosome biogenesis GTPase Der [Armatimonadota bacterium]|jgi:GTP-binding protein
MPTPIIAIVGRTNVGKSTLFNRLVGHQLAVVDDMPGVTRDRLYAEVGIGGRVAILVDTGGLVGAESDELITDVTEQAAAALREADLLIMMVDGLEGVTPADHQVADVVRTTGTPSILVANKMENTAEGIHDFWELGVGEPHRISARTGYGLQSVTEEIAEKLPDTGPVERETDETAVALVGRPNVGKSAIVNSMLGEERVIVSDIPGTTRDAVDIAVDYKGDPFRLIDTAGLRHGARRAEGTEYYSSLRTIRALQRADVGVLVLDAAEGLTRQDERVGGEIEKAGRGIVIAANKWDIIQDVMAPAEDATESEKRRAEKTHRSDFERILRHHMPYLDYAPLVFTSAYTGEGLEELLDTAADVAEQFARRIETPQVNRIIQRAMQQHTPPVRGSRAFKVYYATQLETRPPTFVLKCNDPDLCHFSYQRYLRNKLRQEFGLEGVPIRMKLERR